MYACTYAHVHVCVRAHAHARASICAHMNRYTHKRRHRMRTHPRARARTHTHTTPHAHAHAGGNEWPLACCSSSSLDVTRDLVSTEVALGAKHMLGMEVGNAVCAGSHTYYYYSNMSAHEAIVFKMYDTNEDVPQTCVHTAFDNSAHTAGAMCLHPADHASRESIEVRCIALFAPEQLAAQARLRHRVAAPTTAVARWLVGAK